MNKWRKAAEQAKQGGSDELTPCPTFNLRNVITSSGSYIEQQIEYRNSKNQVVNTEWVAIPTIYI